MNGKENLFELGLGIYCNDGSFPFSLARARFSNIISYRVNCEYCKCGDGIQLKTVRDVSAGEELLVCYSKDGSYWAAILRAVLCKNQTKLEMKNFEAPTQIYMEVGPHEGC